ncbi:MAG: cyanophycin synthetase [Planctomycetes bacterium]|nr:cyanophycin synthetase [Planctomycetota bacterium]
MEFRNIRALRGPNIWTRSTALEVAVDLGEMKFPIREIPGFEGRLRSWLPAVYHPLAHAVDKAEANLSALTLAHVLERAVFVFQHQAGVPVAFSKSASSNEPGMYKVVVEYHEEEVARMAFDSARSLIEAAIHDRPFDVAAVVQKLRSHDQQIRLGPSTGSIVRAGTLRAIPYRRLNTGSLVQFGWGSKQHRILAAETDRTSAIGESIAQDKELTKSLLKSVGVPVPEGRPVNDADEAWAVACEIGLPVVVKPQYGNQGRGVAVNLTTREQVFAAFEAALQEGSSIMVEKFAPGCDHRLLVIGDSVVAAARRQPPLVVGDGVQTVEQLVAVVNLDPRRGEDHATSLSKLRLDSIGLAVLAEQGLTAESVPAPGQVVVLRRNANLSTGGSATDVTDEVHPDLAARAVDAARVVGLDIAGVDVVCVDPSVPLEKQGGVIVEVNAAPGLRMHLEPSAGSPRPVGEAIIETMFPAGDTGRIPVVAITGTNGKTTTTRLIAHMLRACGKRVGMTCTDGIFLNDRRIDTGDCSGPKSARSVLLNPQVDAAVLETARGGILREGLGFDMCDAAVVTNIGEGDHLGLGGIETAEQLAAVKRVIVENVAPTGAAVLNAADPMVVAMAPYCPGGVVFFARDPAHPLLAAHRARGGRAVFVQGDVIMMAEGTRETRVALLDQVPLTERGRIGFQVENVLAAVGAAWTIGLPVDVIHVALTTFVNDAQRTPARFNLFSFSGATIVVDYGHNADALIALIDAISRFPHDRRSVVYTAAGDRRDIDIVRQAEIIGNGFDRVIIYEDKCTRGRSDGEVISLMRKGLSTATRVADVFETRGEFNAIEAGLAALRDGDLILVQADQVEEALEYIQKYIARHAATTPNATAESAQYGASGGPGTHAHGQVTGTQNGATQHHGPTALAEKSGKS